MIFSNSIHPVPGAAANIGPADGQGNIERTHIRTRTHTMLGNMWVERACETKHPAPSTLYACARRAKDDTITTIKWQVEDMINGRHRQTSLLGAEKLREQHRRSIADDTGRDVR